jgi:superfamily I DNA and/or RNA helicase
LNDEDYDVDSDETEKDNDAGAYESILDEATAILPERSLRWHYRSRHEHLIAFSNIKIYNSQLITFPSSTESAPDCGVEYVYVKNGVYDRGGKKNNVMEAKKVAELVFEHFKNGFSEFQDLMDLIVVVTNRARIVTFIADTIINECVYECYEVVFY